MKKISMTNRPEVRLVFLLLTLFLFLGGCGTGTSEPTYNISGTWFMYDDTNSVAGEEGPNTFTFTASGSTVTGTTSQGQPINGTASDQDIDFSWVGSDGATYKYSGAIGGDGETMSGTWSNTAGQNGTWLGVVKLAPSVTIEGTWAIATSGPQGAIDASFTQSGNGISISIAGAQQSPAGTISQVTVAFFVTADGVAYTYVGAVGSDGGSMSGSWTGSNGQSGTWTAKRS